MMKLLSELLEILFPSRHTEVLTRTSTPETLGVHTEPQLHVLGDSSCTSLLPYRVPAVRALILEAKFHEHTRAHQVLGTILREYLMSLVSDDAFTTHPYILVPIPLSKRRMRERGYNQTEQIIKRALSTPLARVTCDTRLLRRTRDTTPQTTLRRAERLKNMHGAFAVFGTVSSSAHYIIVDDVMTTGATLAAAARVLADAGATSIEMLALAH